MQKECENSQVILHSVLPTEHCHIISVLPILVQKEHENSQLILHSILPTEFVVSYPCCVDLCRRSTSTASLLCTAYCPQKCHHTLTVLTCAKEAQCICAQNSVVSSYPCYVDLCRRSMRTACVPQWATLTWRHSWRNSASRRVSATMTT